MRHRDHEVRLLRAAEDDLLETAAYISADNPAAAERTIAKIERGLLNLSRNPRLGRVPGEEELTALGYRYLVVLDYLIFYTIEGPAILVHRIIHGARDYRGLL